MVAAPLECGGLPPVSWVAHCGVQHDKACVAVAREFAGFVRAIACQAAPVPTQAIHRSRRCHGERI